MVFFKKDFLKAKTPQEKMKKISSLITHLEKNKENLTKLWEIEKFSRILNNLQNIKKDQTDEKVENFFNKLIAIDLASKLQNFKTKRLDWDEKNSPEEKTKNLKNLIRPFAVKELENAFFNKNLIENLKSQDSEKQLQAIEEAENLIGMMKTQYQKALVIHCISLTALGIMAAGTTTGLVMLFACPQAAFLILALPHIIYYTGWTMEFAKWYLAAGLLDHKGWKYDVNQGIYTPVKNSIKDIEKTFKKTFDISKKTITYVKENPIVAVSITLIGIMGFLVIKSTLEKF
jgi:cation transport ATPase